MMCDPRADPEGLLRGAIWRARAYNGGLRAEPPAESRGRAPGQGRQSPPEAESFLTFGHQAEMITFVSFAIFCKLRMPNRSYTIQCIGTGIG